MRYVDFSPLWISVKVASVSMIISGFLGLALSFIVHKQVEKGNIKFSSFLDAILTLPMVLPPTVIGYFLLRLFGRHGAVGRILQMFDINILFTWQAMVIAAVFVSFTLMYKSCLSSINNIDRDMIFAARTLGLSEKYIYFKIILPNIKSGILNGLVLVFSRSLGEFGATVMIAGNTPKKTQSMALSIYDAVQGGDGEIAALWITIMIIFSIISILLLHFIVRRGGNNFG